MTQSRFRTAFFAAIMALPTVASTEAAGAAPIEDAQPLLVDDASAR